MSDPKWLDTNVVARIANGDKTLEAEVCKMGKEGHELLLVPQVNAELLYGNVLTMDPKKPITEQMPPPEARAAIESVKARCGIKVDMESQKVPRRQRVGNIMQDDVKRPKNQAVPASLDNISLSDSIVLSQVKASAQVRGIQNPELVTLETGSRAMRSQAFRYGIRSVTAKTGFLPPRMKGVFKSAKWVIADTLLQYVLQYIGQKIMDGINDTKIKNDMKKIDDEMNSYVNLRKTAIVDEAAASGRVYIVAKIQIRYDQTHGQVNLTVYTGIWIMELFISPKEYKGNADFVPKDGVGGMLPPDQRPSLRETLEYTTGRQYDRFYYSSEIRVPPEDIAQYRTVKRLIDGYTDILRNNPLTSALQRHEISTTVSGLWDWIDQSFGMGDFKPDRTLWTSDGYANITGSK